MPNPKLLKADQTDVYERYKEQLKNLEKEKKTDRNGYEIAVYKKNVNNHFGLATNSAFIAFRIGKGYFAPAADPKFG